MGRILAGNISIMIADYLVKIPDTEPTLNNLVKRSVIGINENGLNHYREDKLEDADWQLLDKIALDANLDIKKITTFTRADYEEFERAFNESALKPDWGLVGWFSTEKVDAEKNRRATQLGNLEALKKAVANGTVEILDPNGKPTDALNYDSQMKRSIAEAYIASLEIDAVLNENGTALIPAPRQAAQKDKEPTKLEKMQQAIAAVIASKKFDPMAIPYGGVKAIKTDCEEKYPAVFDALSSFDYAWGKSRHLFKVANYESYAKGGKD